MWAELPDAVIPNPVFTNCPANHLVFTAGRFKLVKDDISSAEPKILRPHHRRWAYAGYASFTLGNAGKVNYLAILDERQNGKACMWMLTVITALMSRTGDLSRATGKPSQIYN